MHRRRVTVANIYPAGRKLTDLSPKSGILGVSVANPTYSGPSLIPLLRWAALHFESVPVLIGDYLERHNIVGFETSDPDIAAAMAMRKADAIRQGIVDAIKKVQSEKFLFFSAYEMMRTSEFGETHSKLAYNYETVLPFRDIILGDVQAFLERKIKRHEIQETSEEVKSQCVSYILEELALFSMMASRGHMVQIYPGRHLSIFVALANNDLKSPVFGLNELTCVDLSVGH